MKDESVSRLLELVKDEEPREQVSDRIISRINVQYLFIHLMELFSVAFGEVIRELGQSEESLVAGSEKDEQ